MSNIAINKANTQPIKCLIVDDELVAVKIIEDNISKLDFLVVEETCCSAIEAAEILK